MTQFFDSAPWNTAVNPSPLSSVEVKLCLLRDGEDSEWDAFVCQHAEGMPYHLSGWSDFLEEVFPQTNGAVVVLRDSASGEIRAGIHLYEAKSLLSGRRWISSPFAALGGGLGASPKELELLLDGIVALHGQSGSLRIELRGLRPTAVPPAGAFESCSEHLHHYLELADRPEALMPGISRCVRRSLVKADRAGIEMRAGASREVIAALGTLHQQARQRLGLPIYPVRLFEALRHHLPDDVVSVTSAVRDGKVLGVLMSLNFGDWTIAEHIGVDDDARALGVSHKLYWNDIERAISEGRRFYSFGRTAVSNSGLLQFKRAWGTTEELLSIGVHAREGERSSRRFKVSRMSPLARWVLRSMPGPIAKVVGGYFYSHWA